MRNSVAKWDLHPFMINGPLVPHELGSFCAVRELHGVPSLET